MPLSIPHGVVHVLLQITRERLEGLQEKLSNAQLEKLGLEQKVRETCVTLEGHAKCIQHNTTSTTPPAQHRHSYRKFCACASSRGSASM